MQADLQIVAAVGVVVVGVLGLLTGEYQARRRYQRRQPDGGIDFGEVCLAVARAKADHSGGELPAAEREYVDGADAVLGKLLEMGHGDEPAELRLAYLAGGEDIEFDVDAVSREDLADLAAVIDEELGDDLRRQL